MTTRILIIAGSDSGGGAGIQPDPPALDLDGIDRAGALRRAAEALLAEAQDPALGAAERDIAASALARLYGLAQEVQA